jgi:glycerophosphoryl diester phosphodiesterase
MPASSHPALQWPGPIPFAHRGGASEAPENTLPAFEHAVELGYRHLETDVHATADGVVVAFHDPDLSRTCGVPRLIGELPWTAVRAARVYGLEPIPLLEDLIGSFPDARFNIDCKADRAAAGLVAAIRRTNSFDRVCVASFGDRRLLALRRALGPSACTALAKVEIAVLRIASWYRGSALAAQVPLRHRRVPLVDRRFVAAAHRCGVQVHVWTIDDADEMRRLLDLGVDGIMTDRPAVLKEVLTERGLWFGGG